MQGESPNERGIQDNLGFWIPAAGSVELGFWIPIISGISDSLSCIPVFPLLGARRRMRLMVERTLKNRFYERFPFNLKFRKIRLVHQMEPSISVWCDRNIRNQLWRWSTLTVLVISVVRAENNVLFHLTKSLFPVPLICKHKRRKNANNGLWIGITFSAPPSLSNVFVNIYNGKCKMNQSI